jgi:hypothetical protein
MGSGLGVSLSVKVRVDDGYAIHNVAVLEECDVHIVGCEYHKQETNAYPLISLPHECVVYGGKSKQIFYNNT